MVTVNYQSAIGAIVSPNRQLLWYNFITTGAFLTGMVRLYLGKLLASVCSFALQFQPKTAPPRVGYALGEVMVLEHVLDFQVFYSHFIATFNNAMRRLKLEVLALIRYPFMGTGDNLALFRSTFAPFFASRQYALMFAELLFRLAIVAWVRNAFAIRINDKRVQSNIHTQRGINGDFHRGWHLNDDCGIPTGRLLGDGQRLNFAVG
jgi:hypothetical protein